MKNVRCRVDYDIKKIRNESYFKIAYYVGYQ